MEIKKQDLEKNNGKEGAPVHVVVDGAVYDLSESKLWKNGKHMNRHGAGTDLSGDFSAAPHGKEVLQRFEKIGEMKEAEADVKLPVPAWIANLINKYPFLKRHPHPMVVHFPMAFFITASLFLFWHYVISPKQSLLDGVYYMHILGTISLPFAIITGWLAWKVNYLGQKIGNVTRKIVLTVVLLVFDIIVLVALTMNPSLLAAPVGLQLLIPVMIFSYLPIVSIIGQQGGQLVY